VSIPFTRDQTLYCYRKAISLFEFVIRSESDNALRVNENIGRWTIAVGPADFILIEDLALVIKDERE
jgi:hypothetical protein